MNSSSFINQYRAAFEKHWLGFLIWGIVLLALGFIAISAATFTTVLSVIFIGTLLFVGGIVMVIDAFTFWWKKGRGFFLVLISGLIYFLIGCIFIMNPIFASESLTLLLGVFYLVIGLFRLGFCAFARIPSWGWSLFSGLISLLLGLLILSNWPESSLFIIGLFVGIDLVFIGWTYIMTSLAARATANKI